MKKILLLFTLLSPSYIFGQGLDARINEQFAPIADWWESFVLTSIPLTDTIGLPIVLIILIGGATFFTFYFSFVNVRKFGLAISTVRGKYDHVEHGEEPITTDTVNVVEGDIVDTIRIEGQEGEVSHFQALAAAVSGTVGLGNIAGVAIAIVVGGPGATFWMILAGLLGMSSKFVECTLGVAYRDVDDSGRVYGGPMYYLSRGLKERGFNGLGKTLAILFAVLCIGASFGGGNMFQSNQAANQIISQFGLQSGAAGSIFGVIFAILVAMVIIGGIKRIGNIAEKIVPFMAVLYVLSCLAVIFLNLDKVGEGISLIFTEAFNPTAVAGGFVGVLITGFRRAAFSNEAGVGSAAIAHSAVKTRYPASEGIVALLEPFIDTVVICTMTALVIIMTGNYLNPDGLNGVDLTTFAFESSIPGSSYILTLAIVLFAFSTMLSWSYYGLQSWMYLFGRGRLTDLTYKVLFLIFIVIGAASTLDAVVKFSDAMILAMVFPNMIGLMFLFPRVRQELRKYLDAIKTSIAS
ncbi:MAG: alanine:cation symporter family protein [Saprospiraceae bacterium]|nr:alanine:cation symporter family protein [Saprospiraceae bacterium]